MPRTTPPKDRFDDLPDDGERVGAHRAENPRLRPGLLFLWSAIAVVVLVTVGIFGTMVATGRVTLFPSPQTTATSTVPPEAPVVPVVDTTYPVVILNATTTRGLAAAMSDTVVAAGWAADSVSPGDAGSQDYPTTTVFYVDPADEAAALGLADVIGGAETAQSDAYAAGGDGTQKQPLTVVIGADRAGGEEPSDG